MLRFSQLAEIMDGQILHLSHDHFISRILSDSRHLVVHPEAIFFAIKGTNNDGHLYLEDAFEQGIVNFVVQHPIVNLPSKLSKVNVIAVSDSIRALQALVGYHRSKFQLPILGITGSNAKTILKEWLFQLLEDRVVIKSPKSYNSQIGVPLSVWQLNTAAEMAIFEAGISRKGEMEHIAAVIRPTMGIFTNIGTAHDAGFSSPEEKIKEKCILFRESQVIIYRRDHQLVDQTMISLFPGDRLLGWSTEGIGNNHYRLVSNGQETICSWEFLKPGKITIPFADSASVENVLHCVTFLLYQGYSSKTIEKRVRALQNIPHRLALEKGMNNCYLVDDTYNNDLAGLVVALDFLNQQPHGKEKVVILSDIRQASGPPKTLYRSIAEHIESYGISKFFGIGEDLYKFQNLFPAGSMFYKDTSEFLEWLTVNTFSDQLLLIKGAREFAFERIVRFLLRNHHGTVLEINLDALAFNLNYFKNQLPKETKIMVMVKAFAYGTGSHEVANLLQYQGVDYLGVAYADEGMDLRKHGIQIPIMVMNPSSDNFSQLIDYQLEPEIYSLQLLSLFQEFCKKKQVVQKVHIKLDTGMHRLGFDLSELDALTQQLTKYPLPIASVFSHLAAAGIPEEDDFSKSQFESFLQGAKKLEALTGSSFLKHILNSSGILLFPEYHLDMVRLGIGLYGVGHNSTLRSISSLKTTISQIKTVNKGETIGYDRLGLVERESKIATIAIGYADGYDRRFGNGVGKVLVGSKLAPVVGNVCMDMTMIDVTDCNAAVGDRVVIFNDEQTIQQLANSIGTIPYELLTNISERVKRVYYLE